MVSVIQLKIYQFLSTHQGPPPTVREIAAAIGKSVSATHATLKKLKEKGFITWDENRCRTITLVQFKSCQP